MEVMLTVFIRLFIRTFSVSVLKHRDRNIAPRTPSDAASLGVAIPKSIDPRTVRIKRVAGTKSRRLLIDSLTRGPGGA